MKKCHDNRLSRTGFSQSRDAATDALAMTGADLTCVIPVRNAQPSILLAVKSTLRALPADATLLVRDDGSDDGTVQALSEIRDRRLRVIEGQRIGIAAGMNELLERTTTRYIARMDADDLCLPYRFSHQMRHMGRADLLFSPWVNWISNTPVIKVKQLNSTGPDLTALHLLVDNPLLNPSMLARTSVLKQLGGVREVASEDYDLWLRAATAGYQLVKAGMPTVLYRRHRRQITQQTAWQQRRSDDTLVHDAWAELARDQLGFVPSWFEWRRSGFQHGQAPTAVLGELDVMRQRVLAAPGPGHRVVTRRLAWMHSKA